MKYFIDTEFLEGTQTKTYFNTKMTVTITILVVLFALLYLDTSLKVVWEWAIVIVSIFFFHFNQRQNPRVEKPTIDLISIGIVAEDGREYYVISKDFNLKEAWNRWEIKENGFRDAGMTKDYRKVYWIRENVLRPIFNDWIEEDRHWTNKDRTLGNWEFTYNNFKYFLKKHGKSNEQIAKEVKEFVDTEKKRYNQFGEYTLTKPEFYGYYADYDWVVFCWLFGLMIDLPNGFPKYCRDLKQMLDESVDSLRWEYGRDIWSNMNRSIHTIGKGVAQEKDRVATFDEKLETVKELIEYPKKTNEHNALADARWNFELYKFIQSL